MKGKDERTSLFLDCSVESGVLSSSQRQNGFPLVKGGRFSLGSDGKVRQGYLGDAYTYNGVRIPKGTLIRFDTPFSVGPMLFGQGTVEHKDRQYEAGMMQIHRDGGVVWGRLKLPAKIKGQTYPAGTELTFRASGKLVNAELP